MMSAYIHVQCLRYLSEYTKRAAAVPLSTLEALTSDTVRDIQIWCRTSMGRVHVGGGPTIVAFTRRDNTAARNQLFEVLSVKNWFQIKSNVHHVCQIKATLG